MASPRPDRALRRLVADLAGASVEDIAAILAKLDAAQRRKVEALLTEYHGGEAATPASMTVSAPAPDAFEGVSPWLAARLSDTPRPEPLLRMTPETGGPSLDHAMTDRALAALRSVANATRASPSPSQLPAMRGEPPPRRDRLKDLLLGGLRRP